MSDRSEVIAGDGHQVVLRGAVTISAVETIFEYLNQLEVDGDIEVDGSEVSMVDGAGLQLLAALHQRCFLHGSKLKITAMSETMSRGIELLGLKAFLLEPASE